MLKKENRINLVIVLLCLILAIQVFVEYKARKIDKAWTEELFQSKWKIKEYEYSVQSMFKRIKERDVVIDSLRTSIDKIAKEKEIIYINSRNEKNRIAKLPLDSNIRILTNRLSQENNPTR